MKLVYQIKDEEKDNVNGILDEDPISRLSITQRAAESLGFEESGSFLILEGDEEICNQAKEKLEGNAEMLSGDKEEEVLSAKEKQEEKSMKGFGGVFSG